MSLFASFTTENRTLLLSDGIVVNTGGLEITQSMTVPADRIHSSSFNKIGRVNGQVAICWIGNKVLKMPKFLSTVTSSDLRGVAGELYQFLQGEIDPRNFENPDYVISCFVIGYTEAAPECIQVRTDKGQLMQDEPVAIPTPGFMCVPNFRTAQEATLDFRDRCYNNSKLYTPEQCALSAFKEVMDNDSIAGGQIFIETLTPH